MAGSDKNSFIAVPPDVTNAQELYRFLQRLIEQLDVAFALRGDSPFAITSQTSINDLAEVSVTATEVYGTTSNYGITVDIAQATGINPELQAVSDQVMVLQTTINEILAGLHSSNIIV